MRLPQTAPDYRQILTETDFSFSDAHRAAQAVESDGRYLHWDDLRRRPAPPGLTMRHWWAIIAIGRVSNAQVVRQMAELYGVPFRFVETPHVRERLHDLDRNPLQRVLLDFVGNDDALSEYRVRQLIEEAIDSSRIEGARSSTRERARQMLREKETPRTKDERMILNNWRAMEHLVNLHETGGRLDLDGFLELHEILGRGALESRRPAGQLRTADDAITVEDMDGEVWHVAPPANPAEGPDIRQRVAALLDFAQPTEPSGAFIHPILRAIIVHFWVGYEHPFCDGNGRMARALFYWVMLNADYELAEFLSISGPIVRRGTAYYRAFAHVETDSGDLTYFILDQLAVLTEAFEDLVTTLRARQQRMAALAEWVAELDELNHRQRSLLDGAIRHPSRRHTIKGHAASHRVHYLTARKDLAELVALGYLTEKRKGNAKRFVLAPAIRGRAREMGR